MHAAVTLLPPHDLGRRVENEQRARPSESLRIERLSQSRSVSVVSANGLHGVNDEVSQEDGLLHVLRLRMPLLQWTVGLAAIAESTAQNPATVPRRLPERR